MKIAELKWDKGSQKSDAFWEYSLTMGENFDVVVTLVELVQREGLEGMLYQALHVEVGAVSFFYIYQSPCGIERVWALVTEQSKAGVGWLSISPRIWSAGWCLQSR